MADFYSAVDISQKFDVVFDDVLAGKTPNLAVMYELKELLSSLAARQE